MRVPVERAKGTRARADLIALLAIAALWAMAIAIVDPRGEFPVTDDWAFIESVRAMVDRGELRFSDWGAMNLVSQILWGSLFGTLFGVNYTVLRISTLIALLLAGLAFYALARTARLQPPLATLATLVVMFNPLAFSLAFSFMTDIPYMAMHLAAMALLAAGYRMRSRLRIALGWGFAAAALLCRQVGIALALGAAGEALLRARWSPRRILLALLPVAGLVALQLGYQKWLVSSGIAPRLYGRQANDLSARLFADPAFIFSEAARAAGWSFFYLGLLMLPVTLILTLRLRSRVPERLRLAATAGLVALLAGIVFLAMRMGQLFPMWGNTIRPEGLGADLGPLVQGASLVGPSAPVWLRVLMTDFAALGGLLLIVCLGVSVLERFRNRATQSFDVGTFALITGLALLAPIMLLELRFDRYFVPIIPCLLIAAAAPAGEWRAPRALLLAGYALLLPIAAYSVVATRDFMETKRVHWRAYSDVTRHARPEHIDGGWVLNGQASFGRFGAARNGDPTNVLRWYERADYMVGTQSVVPGYVAIAAYPVDRWLTWGKPGRPILVQRRASLK